MKANTPNQSTPDLLHELKEMRRELGQLKTLFGSLNKPAIYYSTARATVLYPISRKALFNCAAQGQICPMRAGRSYGWPKDRLDQLTKKRPAGNTN